jgi:hypothetical protein
MVRLRWVLSGLFFVNWTSYLVGMWVGEDEREKIIKTHVYKKLDYVFKY